MNKFTERAKNKGWSMKVLSERWGVTQRQMSNVAKKPKPKDWDALEGLPNKLEREARSA